MEITMKDEQRIKVIQEVSDGRINKEVQKKSPTTFRQ